MSALHEIESKAMHLEPSERALLVRHLIDSLDTEEEANVDEFWIKEVEARYAAYLRGEMKTIPAEEVLGKAYNNLK